MSNFNRLVDCTVAIDAGKRIVVQKSVSGNEPFFTGHFPGRSVMPGVLILETMAQAGAILLTPEDAFPPRLHLTGIRRARFLAPVVPGDILIVSVTLMQRLENSGQAKGDVRLAGKLICDMSFSFSLDWEHRI